MKGFWVIIPVILLNACVKEQSTAPNNPFRVDDGERPWIIAHGGAKHLWPENTYQAFNGSATLGVDALEMDVCLSKDERLVTHHDLTIDRTSNGTGTISEMNYSELQKYHFGEHFQNLEGAFSYRDSFCQLPLLDSVMALYQYMPLVVEIKDAGEHGKKAAEKLKALIDQYDIKNSVLVASFHDDIMAHFHSLGSGYLGSTAQKETTKMVITSRSRTGFAYRTDAVAVQVPMESSNINIAKKRVVNAAHKHHLAIHYWTINQYDNLKLIIEIGADGIITDRPDLLIKLYDELGM